MRRPAPVNQARGDAAPKEKNNEKIRFGVIGCGSIANEYHLPALRRVEGAQLVWACDLIEERAQKAKDDFGFENIRWIITTS